VGMQALHIHHISSVVGFILSMIVFYSRVPHSGPVRKLPSQRIKNPPRLPREFVEKMETLE
jgi:hypothetical protein